jgi:hypothetical protein
MCARRGRAEGPEVDGAALAEREARDGDAVARSVQRVVRACPPHWAATGTPLTLTAARNVRAVCAGRRSSRRGAWPAAHGPAQRAALCVRACVCVRARAHARARVCDCVCACARARGFVGVHTCACVRARVGALPTERASRPHTALIGGSADGVAPPKKLLALPLGCAQPQTKQQSKAKHAPSTVAAQWPQQQGAQRCAARSAKGRRGAAAGAALRPGVCACVHALYRTERARGAGATARP